MSIRLIQQYRAKVEKVIRYGGSRNEGALRKTFQDLLESYAQSKNLLLVPEVEVRTREGRRVVPDGTLKDALRQDWGYWESKDEKDDLPAEIAAKFAAEVDRLSDRAESNKEIADRVDYSIKWTRATKRDLMKGKRYVFNPDAIIDSTYRPFVRRRLYFSKELNEMQYQLPGVFAGENRVIAVSGSSSAKPFSVFAVRDVFSYDLLEKTQGLPFYRYSGTEGVDNVTNWALKVFGEHYSQLGTRITKNDIFHYVYAVLHSPNYRHKYAVNLRREFPCIPLYDDFGKWVEWGQRLMDLHLTYELVEPYRLTREDKDPQSTRRAVVPRLIAHKKIGEIEIDTLTTLRGVPAEAWDYRLGTYSALEWVLERYKERKPKDPTIREKFNTYRFVDYKEHVIDLLRRVCTVSVETMKIIRQMPE